MMNANTDGNSSAAHPDAEYSFLPPESGPKVWMSGDEYRILIDAKNSNGTMTLIDALVPPAGGPPLHSHADVDELFFVLDGELEIMTAGIVHPVKAGGRVFVGRNVPHAFINRSERPVRMLIFYTPAGVEAFFLAAGEPAIEGVAPPAATAEETAREVEIASRYHITQARNINEAADSAGQEHTRHDRP